MPMTVMVVRDVEPRVRGFLTSCMLEVGIGVFVSPRMTRAVRERVLSVLEGWIEPLSGGSLVATWRDPAHPGGQAVVTVGGAPRKLIEHDGIYLVQRAFPDHPVTLNT